MKRKKLTREQTRRAQAKRQRRVEKVRRHKRLRAAVRSNDWDDRYVALMSGIVGRQNMEERYDALTRAASKRMLDGPGTTRMP